MADRAGMSDPGAQGPSAMPALAATKLIRSRNTRSFVARPTTTLPSASSRMQGKPRASPATLQEYKSNWSSDLGLCSRRSGGGSPLRDGGCRYQMPDKRRRPPSGARPARSAGSGSRFLDKSFRKVGIASRMALT
jgi:hypothetical protein